MPLTRITYYLANLQRARREAAKAGRGGDAGRSQPSGKPKRGRRRKR